MAHNPFLCCIYIMGCSHSLREEKPRQRKKKNIQPQELFIPIESKPPTLHNRITLKSITQDTRESRQVTPLTLQASPRLRQQPLPLQSVNPYEMGGQICYGYAGAFVSMQRRKMLGLGNMEV